MKYSIGDLTYQGEAAGVHNWDTIAGSSFYWHPDWLHIAEEATGLTPTAEVMPTIDKVTHDDVTRTIIQHLNSHHK
ncbi:MAG: hypothetical protein ACI90A_001468 [Shewanella sp.]|jgi:hypothetical protein